MKRHLLALGLTGLVISAPAFAGSDPVAADKAAPAAEAAQPAPEHRMFLAENLKWVDAPPSLPRGAKVAILNGDPAAPGAFTMRLMVPAGYKVPPHFHPADENLTVLSGSVYMALGDKWDESRGHVLTPGAFSTMPKGMHHYAWSKDGAVFQVQGIGPWGITYLNPADDPRTRKEASK